MNIELHIEELILHGFPAADRARIAEAVQREITRLLAENNLPQAMERELTLPRLDGGSFAVRPVERPESIGASIGRAVHAGLTTPQGADNWRMK